MTIFDSIRYPIPVGNSGPGFHAYPKDIQDYWWKQDLTIGHQDRVKMLKRYVLERDIDDDI